MKKWVVCLTVLCLLALPGTAFATNWVFVGKTWFGEDHMYVDIDSVIKTGDGLTYWQLLVEDDAWEKAGKTLTKLEFKNTTPRQQRRLAYYLYNGSDQETFQYTKSGGFSPVQKTSPADQCIDLALKHAKEGPDDGGKPPLPKKP